MKIPKEKTSWLGSTILASALSLSLFGFGVQSYNKAYSSFRLDSPHKEVVLEYNVLFDSLSNLKGSYTTEILNYFDEKKSEQDVKAIESLSSLLADYEQREDYKQAMVAKDALDDQATSTFNLGLASFTLGVGFFFSIAYCFSNYVGAKERAKPKLMWANHDTGYVGNNDDLI